MYSLFPYVNKLSHHFKPFKIKYTTQNQLWYGGDVGNISSIFTVLDNNGMQTKKLRFNKLIPFLTGMLTNTVWPG